MDQLFIEYFQDQADHLMAASVRELGFIVVTYKPDELPVIGAECNIIWSVFRAPQPFVVVREASLQERDLQVAIFTRETGLKPDPIFFTGVPFILVTD